MTNEIRVFIPDNKLTGSSMRVDITKSTNIWKKDLDHLHSFGGPVGRSINKLNFYLRTEEGKRRKGREREGKK